jgi:uncharacterized membrane protein YdbT with pleckstrin-like domain
MLRPVTTPETATPAAPSGEIILFEGHPATCPTIGSWVVVVLTLGLAWFYFLARARATRFKVTTQRVVVETGLLSKRMDQLDIYRINDFVVERPFGQRLAGTGNLVLTAMDRTTPEMRLQGLQTDVVALYERLRSAAEEAKRVRGVRVIDNELQSAR